MRAGCTADSYICLSNYIFIDNKDVSRCRFTEINNTLKYALGYSEQFSRYL
jgi:hypothetical protein